jgi:tetratricopeptide (TPR) repeat protein
MPSTSQSIEKLQKKLDKDPGSLIFFQLAEEHRKEGNLEEAETILKQGLTRHPNYWSARVTLARIYQQSGNADSAQSELEKVVHAVPDHLLANRLLGEMYLSKTAWQDALRCLRVVQMLNPADHEISEQVKRLEAALKPAAVQPEEHRAAPEPLQMPKFEQEQEQEQYAPTVQMQVPQFLEKTDAIKETGAGAPEPPTLKFDSVEKVNIPEEPAQPAEVTSPFHVQEYSETEQDLEAEEDLVVESAEPLTESETEESRSTAEELSSIANLLFTPEEEPVIQDSDFQELEPELVEEPFEEEAIRDPSQDRTQPIEEEEDEDVEELTTETLAELYLNQGLVDKAVKVYQKLLLSDPGNMQILQRLRELNPAVEPERKPAHEVLIAEAEVAAVPASEPDDATVRESARRRKIQILENWLSTIHRERHDSGR